MTNSEPCGESEMFALAEEIFDICENERAKMQRAFYDFREELNQELRDHLEILKATDATREARTMKINRFQSILNAEAKRYEAIFAEIERKERQLSMAAREYAARKHAQERESTIQPSHPV